jgi:hypothetical protein
MPSQRLLEAIAVTAELTGTTLSEPAAKVMASDLARYPEGQLLEALTRCRRELRGRLTIADVVGRLDDGRPGPEEAWAMIPPDEAGSVVWTEEMAQAYGVACGATDRIQARMAFLEAYRDRVRRSRDDGTPVKWTPSLGHDPAGREQALVAAMDAGRITEGHVISLLPHYVAPSVVKRIEQMQSWLLRKPEAA